MQCLPAVATDIMEGNQATNVFRLSRLRKTLIKMCVYPSPTSSSGDPDSPISHTRTTSPTPKPGPVVPVTATPPAPVAEATLIPRNDTPADSAPIETPANKAMPVRPESRSTPASSTIAASPSSSPTMKKASPMPLPAYPTPNAPWQHTNGVNSGGQESSPSPTSAGKTSQVLAKLTSENDRLRREIKAEKAAKEEALQQYQLLKGRVNRLEEQNGTIQMQFDHNESALARKERRIDDLRETLEEEIARRKRAEEREAEIGRKLGETVSQTAQEVSEAHAAQKCSDSAYGTLKKEYTGLERRIQSLRQEQETALQRIDSEKAIHRKQLTQLEILLDQERHLHEKSNKDVREMAVLLQSYRATEDNAKRLEKEMQDTVHEMRWAMRLQAAREEQRSDSRDKEN